MSESDYLAYVLRTQSMVEKAMATEGAKEVVAGARAELESKLHDEILKYCASKLWYVVHARMDRPATTAEGTPDFIIAADGGRTFWIECKKKGAKPTEKQAEALYWLKARGHVAAAVWSFAEFLGVVNP